MAEMDLDGGAVVDALDHAIVVVDGDAVVEYNERFRTLIGLPDATERVTLSSALSAEPELLDAIEDRKETTVRVTTDSGEKYFQVSLSQMADESGESVGEVVMLHDVTEQQQRRKELQRQNEQLDQFASLISHDLRNPLDVAIGRTAVVGELVDDPKVTDHLEEIEAAHARIKRIIHDVLTLARQGRSIDDKSRVVIEDIAQSAWTHVDTDNATLKVTDDVALLADGERLEQIFENLFRNAVEHGRDDTDKICIEVGELDDATGFYVADDGQGLPDTERDEILEPGYTGTDGNTGLGLAIVENIAEAHDWELSLETSTDGGARFEFSGVELVSGEHATA